MTMEEHRAGEMASKVKMNVEAAAPEEAITASQRGDVKLRRESSLVFPPDRTDAIKELAFLDLKYEVENMRPGKETEMLKVLDGVSGQANSQEMLALMGPPGSGKTSLLNVLAQRVPHKSVTGRVFVDGHPLSKSFKRRMGFVFQDDLCLWNLTVRETVMFAAKLRLPQEIPDKEKEKRVAELLELLGLSHVADGIIGKEHKKKQKKARWIMPYKERRRGISSGERKRVSIGVELITSPDVLFLDEPTSGLDSSTALSIMNILGTLTEKGMIVVCSIHQPRSNIFSLFDKVLLLNKGKTVYYGACGSTVKYFETLGLNLPPETNPADWILDLTMSSQKLRDGKPLHEAYQQHMARPTTERERLEMTIPTESTISKTRDRLEDSGSINSKWTTSFWYELRVLLQRQSKQSRGEIFNAYLGCMFVYAVIPSAIFFQSDNIADIAGLVYCISFNHGYLTTMRGGKLSPPERSLMIRECSTGFYRVGPYFLAKSTSDMGICALAHILYATATYWCMGLRLEAGAFFIFLLLVMGQVMVGQSIGPLLSTATSDAITPKSFSFAFVLSLTQNGVFMVFYDVPEEIAWVKYLSSWFYGFRPPLQ